MRKEEGEHDAAILGEHPLAGTALWAVPVYLRLAAPRPEHDSPVSKMLVSMIEYWYPTGLRAQEVWPTHPDPWSSGRHLLSSPSIVVTTHPCPRTLAGAALLLLAVARAAS